MKQLKRSVKGIMVVDDNVGRLRLICLFLKQSGFVPLAVRSKALALEALESLMPDFFIISAHLEGNSGIDLCHKLRSASHISKSPVLLLITSGDETAIHDHSAVDDYLTIPFVSYELVNKVQNLLFDKAPV